MSKYHIEVAHWSEKYSLRLSKTPSEGSFLLNVVLYTDERVPLIVEHPVIE